MAEGEFGGLCENGHDVPPGARFCPSCGAPAHGPSIPKAEEGGAPWGPPGQWTGPPPQGPHGYPPPASPPPGYGAPPPPGYGAPPPPGWYGPPQQPLPSYWSYGPRQGRVNGLAVASMVLGILWLWWIGSILAVVLGHVALRQIRSTMERGRGMAIAGLALGYLGLVAGILAIIGAVLSS